MDADRYTISPEKNTTKPQYCPERNCACMHVEGIPESTDRNYSFYCFGKMANPVTMVVNQPGIPPATHDNIYYFCIWTPAKGWVKVMTNDGDMASIRKIVKTWEKIMEV